MVVEPCLMCSRLISARISSRSLASSAPIGSSIRIAFGLRTNARPIATRCMSPPESADGLRAKQRGDAQRLGDPANLLIDLGLALARRSQRKGDVLVDRKMRIESEGLEDEGDVAVGRLEVLHRLAVDEDVAAVDILKSGDGAQRRRLAAARLAEHDDELVVGDVKVEVLDDLDVAEELLDAAKLDLGHE